MVSLVTELREDWRSHKIKGGRKWQGLGGIECSALSSWVRKIFQIFQRRCQFGNLGMRQQVWLDGFGDHQHMVSMSSLELDDSWAQARPHLCPGCKGESDRQIKMWFRLRYFSGSSWLRIKSRLLYIVNNSRSVPGNFQSLFSYSLPGTCIPDTWTPCEPSPGWLSFPLEYWMTCQVCGYVLPFHSRALAFLPLIWKSLLFWFPPLVWIGSHLGVPLANVLFLSDYLSGW